ncbi:hypothetical protein [Yoonia sp.]|uniref:hypothetical protein n=1 Tax=Yoonia sp. TaxID=2212373 RepID=UPI0019E74437|nr:hypothetical protein [Yoonia sp.]MBE0413462.1 hypothetical protein [Yoonia sp.]
MKWVFIVLAVLAGPGIADPVDDVAAAAQRAFDRMPVLRRVAQIPGSCGADDTVFDAVVYCTTRNVVYVTTAAAVLPQAVYLVGHAYGHAAQVQHGVADLALAQIRARPRKETMLRGLVERQVDCLAGFFVARAGLPRSDLTGWFNTDPLAAAHWGRDPLRIGPRVRVALDARNDWFQRGQGGELAACAVGEFGAELLVQALKS